MGTRSIVAEPHGDGWRGRYCHWDGYPEGVGEEVRRLVQREGVERVRQVLLHDHGYWSSINASRWDDPYQAARGGFEAVPGWGITSASRAAEDGDYFTQDHHRCGAEYLYVIADSALWVHEIDWRDEIGQPTLVPWDVSLREEVSR